MIKIILVILLFTFLVYNIDLNYINRIYDNTTDNIINNKKFLTSTKHKNINNNKSNNYNSNDKINKDINANAIDNVYTNNNFMRNKNENKKLNIFSHTNNNNYSINGKKNSENSEDEIDKFHKNFFTFRNLNYEDSSFRIDPVDKINYYNLNSDMTNAKIKDVYDHIVS